MRFDQKLMNYAITEELTKTKIINCRKVIERQYNAFGGFTFLQMKSIQVILKTMKKRIEEQCPDLLECFNSYLNDLLEIKF